METHEIPESQSPKTARLEARVTEEQKELFAKAAILLGRSLSDFVVTSVCETAARTVREHELMTLSARDREIFVSALLNPPAPGARLRKAARRYKERVGGE
ncbi:MAG TPA: DUF1778 domain-containing protein [Candidatus Binatia bacterium]